MYRKTQNRVLWWILASLILWVAIRPGLHEFLRHGSFWLGIEPRYDGKTLSDWTQHAHHYYGSQSIANPDATEAIQAMFPDALPFLVKWIATPGYSPREGDYESQALAAFQLLGPNAKPAIPYLIKVIGRNNNWPASALACTGTNAVPALIELLATNRAPDFHGNWRMNIPDNLVRENAILTLTYLGTNAQGALPVLMECYKDEEKRSRADMARALADVGHNRPEIMIPALAQLLTNSGGMSKYSAPQALASFGRSAMPAVPALLAASQTADAQTKARIAVAIKEISPDSPNALSPLLANLSSEDIGLRESAFWNLDSLGTNGAESLAVVENMAKHEPNPDLRTRAMNWVAKMETNTNILLGLVQLNLTNENESVACAAVRCLGAMADGSPARFGELLMAFNSQRNEQVRESAGTCLYPIMEEHPEYLLASLSSPQTEISLSAMRFMHSLKQEVLIINRREPEPSTNFQVYVMKEIKGDARKKLQGAIPMLVEKLHDENWDTRELATNILLELSPKAAKDAGVVVAPPYSFYAD